jgi:hypothetical protein
MRRAKRARNLHSTRSRFAFSKRLVDNPFCGEQFVVISNPLTESVLSGGGNPWDARVLTDLTNLSYTRAVVFTDGLGRVLHWVTRTEPPKWIGELVDITSGALSQLGSRLGLGTPGVCVCTFHMGVVILSRSETTRVAVLADETANLGQLLNHVRHIFSRAVT